MEQDVNLNIPYSAPLYIWDKIGEVFASMLYWNGGEEGPRWTGPDIDLWASAESGGIHINLFRKISHSFIRRLRKNR